jgi:hypothetical protein
MRGSPISWPTICDFRSVCLLTSAGTRPESEEIPIAVSADDMEAGDMKNPERHPLAIALRRERGVDDARVSKREAKRVQSQNQFNGLSGQWH